MKPTSARLTLPKIHFSHEQPRGEESTNSTFSCACGPHGACIRQLQLLSKCPLLQLCRAGSKLRFGTTKKLRIEPIPTPVVQAMLLDNASPMHEDCLGAIVAPPTHLLRDVGSHFSADRTIPRLPHLPPPPSTRQAPLPSTRNRRNVARPREMLPRWHCQE